MDILIATGKDPKNVNYIYEQQTLIFSLLSAQKFSPECKIRILYINTKL